MDVPERRVQLAGSDRQPLPGARAVGPVDPNARFEVTVLLRSRQSPDDLSKLASDAGALEPSQRRHLTRDEYALAAGADEKDISQVEAFAHEHGLDVVEASQPRRTIVLSGTTAAFAQAFSVQLERYEHESGSYRGRSGPVSIPEALENVVVGVFGLDDRPQADPHFRPAASTAASAASLTPVAVAHLYDYPAGLDGTGECVAILELGGGYRNADLKAYFKHLGLAVPAVTAVSVDGGHNQPTGSATGPDGEVMLDIEVVGAIAPKARIAVYFAPNTDRGFLDALSTAVHDNLRKPTVVSISWGGPEASWTAQAMTAFDQAAQAAAALGVTICAASGDNGSGDGVADGKAHVDFPASSPHILACGGTNLQSSAGRIVTETVWNNPAGGATGGGVSDIFPPPTWQSGANVPPSTNPGHAKGRGVPDVAGDADPATGYQIQVDGQQVVFGGTSAVAPLWSALIALVNQHLGKPLGFLNPLLYAKVGSGAFHDITIGNNGAYSAGVGWDACTGLGTPDGAKLMLTLTPGGTGVASKP